MQGNGRKRTQNRAHANKATQDFFLSFDGRLNPENRWVKLAKLVSCSDEGIRVVAPMQILTKRTKRGGYSWSKCGVRAMLSTIMRSKEAGVVRRASGEHAGEKPTKHPVSMRQ